MRFAAHSASLNKSGASSRTLEIPDFRKAALSLSGVILGVSPSLASAPKDFLADVVPVTPTTQRTFMAGHRPTAYLQVYQGGKKDLVPVTLTTTIVNDQDKTVFSASRPLGPSDFTAGRAADHRFDLPIEDLLPGAYLLRFEAVAGKLTASKDLRFVVRK